MRKYFKNSVAAALAAALVLSSIGFESAQARSRHHHSRTNAAAAGAIIGLFGAIAAAAAADSYRHRYYGPYDGTYYGPGYAYSPPAYRSYRSYRSNRSYRSYGRAPHYRRLPAQNWRNTPGMNR